MKHGRYPYRGISEGISDFGDSLCESSLYNDTRIDTIFHNFRVTGVLPQIGRASLPSDVVFGDYDFATLRARLDELRAQGITEEQIMEMLQNGNFDGNADSASGEHGSTSGVAAPQSDGQTVAAANGGQGSSSEQL